MGWNTAIKESTKLPISSIKPIGLKEAGLGIVATGGNLTQFTASIPGRPKGEKQESLKPFEQYITAYTGVPIVAAAIDRTVDFVVSPGYYTVSESKSAKEVIDEFIDSIDFDIFLRNVVKDMLIFGDSFVEIVSGKNGIKELKVISPDTMRVKRTRTGDVTGYIQDLGLTDKNPQWSSDKIAHFVFNRIGHSPYGTSIIHPLLTVVKLKIDMENSMGQIMKRKSSAPIHVKMGSDEFPATQDDIDSMASQLQYMDNKTEWVTGHTTEMDVVGFKSKIIDIEPFTVHFDNQMTYGLQVPYVLLGSARIPEGLARVQLEAMDRRAKSIQDTVEAQLESKIFQKVLEANGISDVKVEFQWGNPSDEMFTDEVTRYINLMNSPLTNKTKFELENRLRRLLEIDGEITEQDYEKVEQMNNNPKEDKKNPVRDNKSKLEKKVDDLEAFS